MALERRTVMTVREEMKKWPEIFSGDLRPFGTSKHSPGLVEQFVAADDAGQAFISKDRDGRRAAEL